MKLTKTMVFVLIPIFAVMIIVGAIFLFKPVKNEKTSIDAPEFTYTLLNGKKVSLKDYRGKKPVVVNFWASWCPPCRAEAPTLTKVANKYKGKVQFLGVIYQDQPHTAQKYIDEFKVPYPNGIDAGETIGRDYKITGIPVTFFITVDGAVQARWIGGIEEATLIKYLDKLL